MALLGAVLFAAYHIFELPSEWALGGGYASRAVGGLVAVRRSSAPGVGDRRRPRYGDTTAASPRRPARHRCGGSARTDRDACNGRRSARSARGSCGKAVPDKNIFSALTGLPNVPPLLCRVVFVAPGGQRQAKTRAGTAEPGLCSKDDRRQYRGRLGGPSRNCRYIEAYGAQRSRLFFERPNRPVCNLSPAY
jgi:hypothetical protein